MEDILDCVPWKGLVCFTNEQCVTWLEAESPKTRLMSTATNRGHYERRKLRKIAGTYTLDRGAHERRVHPITVLYK